MKTILVGYSYEKLTKRETQTLRRYAFNTESPVKIGDRFESDDYDTPMQVVEAYNIAYKYVDTHTGKLSNNPIRSTKAFEIRRIKIVDEKDSEVIECRKVSE